MSAPWRSTHTAAVSSRLGSARAFSSTSRSMTTSRRSTPGACAARSTSCAPGGRASHSAQRLLDADWVEPIHVTFGRRCAGSRASADPRSCSERMSRAKRSAMRSETFEQWATESLRFSASVRAMLALRSTDTGTGCSPKLPTLTETGNMLSPSMQKWPAHRNLATLTARDWKSGKASPATHARNSRPLSEQPGGLLHPDFADWYQGAPVGWSRAESASRRQATRRFRRWLRRHSES